MNKNIIEVANIISNKLGCGISRLDYQFNFITLKASTRVWLTNRDYFDIKDDGNIIETELRTYHIDEYIAYLENIQV